MVDEVRACPDCGAIGPRRQNPGHPHSTADCKWYCLRCQEQFDDPDWVEKENQGGLSGLAKVLDETPAEEVP